jgi:putative transposase
VALPGGQLSHVDSLRDIENLFDAHRSHHYHLHCNGVKRSTLADANNKRDYRVFADIAQALMAMEGGRRDGMKQLLRVLDSSPFQLSGRGHEWAERSRQLEYSQGLKLHLMMEPGSGAVDYANVTDMNVNDITDAREIPLENDRIYIFDKGYLDFNWWLEIIEAGSHFVTRIKKNTACKVVGTRPLAADENANVLSDMVIELTNKSPRGGKKNKLAGRPLRLVEIEHPGGKKDSPFYIVSDMLEASASEIAACYKQRWQIELLFKWLKQNLKIRRFLGESRNAVMIQIYVAIIAYLLLRMYGKLLGDRFKGRLKDLVVSLKTALFQRLGEQIERRKSASELQPMLSETW